ncbi:hypothetical protein EYB53_001395 [Candidatus Chloroploca sp. M-50]|uniref:Uncharacterized protein n=1 Tax=Candidatus Chloroploca mongolica TaxID=2528176 RepID=A0ABS4D4I5_9CHLR|nr:hypothetical protein [Candidatus Chloroploca mongolica]MBP1464350.1 hypothetical protein [Candidatus Chloroploca mongolica]
MSMNLRRNERATGSHDDDAAPQAANYLRSHSIDEMANDVQDKVDAVTESRFNKATKAAADALERSGDYLQDQDVNGLRGGLKKMIRRYPIPILLITAVVTFMLGRKIFQTFR